MLPASSPDEEILPLAEEELRVTAEPHVKSVIHVRTRTRQVEETLATELASDEVEITRIPVNRIVEAAPAIHTEGDVTIIPVLEEVAVVEKRLMLREELHVRRHRHTRTAEIPVTRRRQEAEIKREPTNRQTEEE